MDENKYIGILMNKKEVTEGVHIYFPDHIIEGHLIEDEIDGIGLFEELYNLKNFLLMNDVNGAFSDEDVVGFIIKEKDLLEQEEGLSLEEAKQEYFDNASEYTLVGFYIYEQEKIEFLKLGISDLFSYISELGLKNCNPFDFISSDKLYKILLDANEGIDSLVMEEEQHLGINEENDIEVAIPFEDIHRLLELNPEEIKDDLEKMVESYNQIMSISNNSSKEESKDISKKDVLHNLDDAYNYILSINDIKDIKNVIRQLVSMYIDFVVSLDSYIDNEKTHDVVTSHFYGIIDLYNSLLKVNNISVIKQNIKKIRNRQRKYIDSMSDFDSRKYFEYIKKQKELKSVFEKKEENKTKSKKSISFEPKDMKEFFDKKIIGQEQAKIDVISALFMNSLLDDPNSKNSCLLIGPTGSGKTLIAKAASEFLDLPCVCIDTTQLSAPGYVGSNLEDFLVRLISVADGDIERAERGIVILDEIDKKGTDNNDDVSGRGVLNTLLPFIQGTTYNLPNESSLAKRKSSFDTSRLTIFATGAFTGVNNQKGYSSYSNSSIGFNVGDKDTKEDIKYDKISREDLEKYGKMPIELLGRFTTITQLSGHTKESLKTILTDSNESALLKEKEKLAVVNINLKWNDEYLDKVAEHALELKTGARSLKSTVEASISSARWEAITNLGEITGIVLNGEAVTNPDKAILVYKDGCCNTVDEIKQSRNREKSKIKEKNNDK